MKHSLLCCTLQIPGQGLCSLCCLLFSPQFQFPVNIILIFILNDDFTEAHRNMWVVKAEGKDQTGRDPLNKRKDRMSDSVLNMIGHCLFSSLQRGILSSAEYIV